MNKKHDINRCNCAACKSIRGEYLGDNNPFSGKIHSKNTKKRMSLIKKGKPLNHKINCSCCICKAKRGETKGNKNPFSGKKHTEETKKRLSEIGKNLFGNRNGFFGKHHTNQSKKLNSLAHGGTGIPGELSEYGINFTNILKEQIRKRDNYRCQLCGITQKQLLKIIKRILSVHHIDYNKLNNSKNNLITLCSFCHGITNVNRKEWKKYFYKLFKKRGIK